jgi:hypothetical protein
VRGPENVLAQAGSKQGWILPYSDFSSILALNKLVDASTLGKAIDFAEFINSKLISSLQTNPEIMSDLSTSWPVS